MFDFFLGLWVYSLPSSPPVVSSRPCWQLFSLTISPGSSPSVEAAVREADWSKHHHQNQWVHTVYVLVVSRSSGGTGRLIKTSITIKITVYAFVLISWPRPDFCCLSSWKVASFPGSQKMLTPTNSCVYEVLRAGHITCIHTYTCFMGLLCMYRCSCVYEPCTYAIYYTVYCIHVCALQKPNTAVCQTQGVHAWNMGWIDFYPGLLLVHVHHLTICNYHCLLIDDDSVYTLLFLLQLAVLAESHPYNPLWAQLG